MDDWDPDKPIWQQDQELRLAWIEKANIEWLDDLIDLFAAPPDWSEYDGMWGDNWQLEIAYLLGDWADNDPEHVIPRMGAALLAGRARYLLLKGFAWTNHPEAIPWLVSLLDEVETFSEDEIISLSEALGVNGGLESIPYLERMKALVSSEMHEAQMEIESKIVFYGPNGEAERIRQHRLLLDSLSPPHDKPI